MRLRIGEFTFDGGARELSLGGNVRRLEPKAATVLARLAAAPLTPVRRQDLLDAGWPDGSGSDEALTQAISQIRRALAVAPGGGTYIQTISRTGYRLMTDVAPLTAEARAQATPQDTPLRVRSRSALLGRTGPLLLGGLVVFLLGVLMIEPGAPHRVRHLIRHTFGAMQLPVSASPTESRYRTHPSEPGR